MTVSQFNRAHGTKNRINKKKTKNRACLVELVAAGNPWIQPRVCLLARNSASYHIVIQTTLLSVELTELYVCGASMTGGDFTARTYVRLPTSCVRTCSWV